MTQTSLSDWQAKAAALRFPHQAFVDGKHVDALSGATFDALESDRRRRARQGRAL